LNFVNHYKNIIGKEIALIKIPRIYQDFREFLECQFSKCENFEIPKKYQENINGEEVALSKIPRNFQDFREHLESILGK